MTNLDSILKSRDISLLTNIRIVKAMYRYKSWTMKKAEHWKNDAFKVLCWRRLLRVTWTARRSNQSSIIIIGRIDAEAPILWPLDVKSRLIGKDSDAGTDWGKRRRGWQRMRWLDSITDSGDMNLSKLQETVKDREAWRIAFHGVTKNNNATEWKGVLWFHVQTRHFPQTE